MANDAFNRPELTLWRKLLSLNWLFVLLVVAVAGIGFAMLYSAANGRLDPWASRQMARFAAGLAVMVGVAMVDVRHWLRGAYVFYGCVLAALAAVEVVGLEGMGARRWIDLGFFAVQPSELMKIALVLVLARYFHGVRAENAGRIRHLVVPLPLVIAPAVLILRQPDLGTAAMVVAIAAAMFFLGGVRLRVFAAVGVAALASVPVIWRFLHDYQRQRVLSFLDPESDPLGAGYHIIQSKIALGSGGVFGRGFLQGTQSHLSFLPERQTDFIFTMYAEEFGLIGALVLLGLYFLMLAYGVAIALRAKSQFARLLAMGVMTTFFLYVFVNVAMVTGLIPVVGAPLPLVSYGGTAMLTVLFGFGLVLGVYVHRDVEIPRRGVEDEP